MGSSSDSHGGLHNWSRSIDFVSYIG
jgi:hypothetical protein